MSGAAFYVIMPSILLVFSNRLDLSNSSAALWTGAIIILGRLVASPIGFILFKLNWKSVAIFGSVLSGCCSLTAYFETQYDFIVLPLVLIAQSLGGVLTFISLRTGIARCFAKEHHPTLFGNLHIAVNLGVALGPFVAVNLIEKNDFHNIFLLSATFQFLAAGILSRVKLNEVRQDERQKNKSVKQSNIFLVSMFFLTFGTAGLIHQFILVLEFFSLQKWASNEFAGMFFTGNAILVIFLMPFATKLLKKLSLKNLFLHAVTGAFLIPITFIGFSFINDPIIAIVVLVVFLSISEVVLIPSQGALIPRFLSPKSYGNGFSILSMAQVLAYGVSTIFSSASLQLIENKNAQQYWIMVSLLFGLFILLSLLFGLYGFHKQLNKKIR